ncbi:MAG: hypothetical protein HY898_26510 [Deltaproteobacteria bacterium]|nr:hypothetical protein [Deltaproteobacteria bacterium]
MSQDRRRHRSSIREKALDLSLCAAARSARIAGVVLADSRGLLVASSMKGPGAEMLAAAGAVLASTGLMPEFCGPRLPSRIVARKLRHNREVFCLCAAGEPREARTAVRLAGICVKRILRTGG